MSRYTDPFLNALMYSHQIVVRGELWYNNALVGPIDIVGGSVNADRAGSVRRTAQLQLDAGVLDDPVTGPRLDPYGSRVKLFRGIRYAAGAVEEVQVFFGRIDAVEVRLDGIAVRCSDLAADVVDARFLTPMSPSRLAGAPTTLLGCIKALVNDVHPGMGWNTSGVTATTATVNPATTWSQERGDALDSLCTQLQGGCEWYIDVDGTAHVHPLPAVITAGTPAVWILDTGDLGVLVDRTATVDRQGVYNGVAVTGEPIGGTQPAEGTWTDTTPGSSTLWGGPFGKVVAYYTGQQLSPNTTAEAQKLAQTLGVNSIASVRNLTATCIPNPKLRLGDVVRVFSASADIDGMYFVQNFTLPLDPEQAMTVTLYAALEQAGTQWRDAELRIPEGATWRPTR